MATPGTEVRRRHDTRARIIEAAEGLIATHGVEGFQLKDVADQVGIRPPSVFAHFKGRDAIAEAVSQRLVASMLDLLVIMPGESPETTFSRWIMELVQHLESNPAHIRIILRDMAQSGSANMKNHEATENLLQECEERIQSLIAAGEATGVFRHVRAGSVISHFTGAALAGLAWNGFDNEGKPCPESPFDDIREEICDLMLAYLLKCK